MYGMTTLRRIDDHTLACRAEGRDVDARTAGSGSGLRRTAHDRPAGDGPSRPVVHGGDSADHLERGEARRAAARRSRARERREARVRHRSRRNRTSRPESRHTLGAFQIQIPVRTKQTLLEPEERTYSVLKYIEQTIPHENRWYPVFEKYVGVIGDRVKALGGDPTRIRPSPDGSGVHPEPQTGDRSRLRTTAATVRLRFTGKVDGIVYDRFGDFEGFVLETEDGPRHFKCRETELENVLDARVERTRADDGDRRSGFGGAAAGSDPVRSASTVQKRRRAPVTADTLSR